MIRTDVRFLATRRIISLFLYVIVFNKYFFMFPCVLTIYSICDKSDNLVTNAARGTRIRYQISVDAPRSLLLNCLTFDDINDKLFFAVVCVIRCMWFQKFLLALIILRPSNKTLHWVLFMLTQCDAIKYRLDCDQDGTLASRVTSWLHFAPPAALE